MKPNVLQNLFFCFTDESINYGKIFIFERTIPLCQQKLNSLSIIYKLKPSKLPFVKSFA